MVLGTKPMVSAVLAVVLLQGCFAGRVSTRAPKEDDVEQRTQWFAFGGLAPLSDPAGGECQYGIRKAEVSIGPLDFMTSLGLALLGGLIGGVACAGTIDQNTIVACASGGSAVAVFALGSRSVEYQCAGKARGKRPPRPVADRANTPGDPKVEPTSACTAALIEEMRAAKVGEDAIRSACGEPTNTPSEAKPDSEPRPTKEPETKQDRSAGKCTPELEQEMRAAKVGEDAIKAACGK